MEIVKQLAIFLENQPGALLRVTKDLAAHNINIKALAVSDGVDHAVVRLVVDDCTRALHLLEEAGVLVVETELLQVSLQNRPGMLTKLCSTLEEIKMNIEYAYGSTTGNDGEIYLRVKDPHKVQEALAKA